MPGNRQSHCIGQPTVGQNCGLVDGFLRNRGGDLQLTRAWTLCCRFPAGNSNHGRIKRRGRHHRPCPKKNGVLLRTKLGLAPRVEWPGCTACTYICELTGACHQFFMPCIKLGHLSRDTRSQKSIRPRTQSLAKLAGVLLTLLASNRHLHLALSPQDHTRRS